MSLANCKHCSKLFVQGTHVEYCAQCKTLQDEWYRRIREFVRKHPKSTVMDVHLNTGIPISKVLELQKEGCSI